LLLFFNVSDELGIGTILSSSFLTWAPESSDPEEIESVSLAVPSRDEELEKR